MLNKTVKVNKTEEHLVSQESAGKDMGIDLFDKYLTVWVVLCMAAGTLIGFSWPLVAKSLVKMTYYQISVPVAVLIWVMIYPMMVQIDFSSILEASKKPKGLIITTVSNWLIKPFTMFLIAFVFFRFLYSAFITPQMANQYLAGAILLGAAPCTAMVFVWSYLSKGDPAYTLLQVAVNDLIILFAYAPIVMFLMGISSLKIPYETVFLSVVLFVVIPLAAGFVSRLLLIKAKGRDWFESVFIKNLGVITKIGLLITLIIIFIFQGRTIIENPLIIILIAIPLIIQTYLIFSIAYGWAWFWKVKYKTAAPAGFVAASNFFELAVAVAIALFGINSGATLVTVVGVLVEVPIMLSLVNIANKTQHHIHQRSA